MARVRGRLVLPSGATSPTVATSWHWLSVLAHSSVPGKVKDFLVHNGAKAHDSTPYLTALETGAAIAAGLREP